MTRRREAAFCVYMVIAASGWMLQLAFPSSVPDSETEILVFAFAGIGALVWGPGWGAIRRIRTGKAIISGLLLFGLPWVLSTFWGSRLPAFTRVSFLALVPAGVVLVSAIRDTGGFVFLSLLGASLAGLAGAFLLLPADPVLLLHGPMSAIAMLAVVVSISIGGYLAYGATRGLPLRMSLVLMLVPSLVLMSATSVAMHSLTAVPGVHDVAVVVWGSAEVALLIYLIQTMPPVSLAARYLLVPLATALEGFVYLQPAISWRMLFGMGLLIFGGVRLLVRGGRQPDSPVSLL